MAIRQIRKEGDTILRKVCRKVEIIDDKILELIKDMYETMYHVEGVGLAANQIGILKRIAVIDVGDGPITVINPEISNMSEEQNKLYEGCLSIPNYSGVVERPNELDLSYTDEKGEIKKIHAKGFFARAICHEVDHLNGILFKDKVIIDEDIQHLKDYK